jgi:hypothetical protein
VTPSRRLSVCYRVPGHDLLDSVGPSRNDLNLAHALSAWADVTAAFRRVADDNRPEVLRVLEIQPGDQAATMDDAAMRGIGYEYERVLAELIAEINALRDAQTGRRIVRGIIRTDQAFPGERSAYLPDLIVRWDASAPITAATSPPVGKVSSPTPDTRPGADCGPGFILLREREFPAEPNCWAATSWISRRRW